MNERIYHEADFEHGLRCAACSRLFTEGMPFSERLDSFSDGVPLVILTCVECALTGAQLPNDDPASPEPTEAPE